MELSEAPTEEINTPEEAEATAPTPAEETAGDGYLTVDEFVQSRFREFPVLHEALPPVPVRATGELANLYSTWPAGVETVDPDRDVLAVRLRPADGGPAIRAYLDEPLEPAMLDYLQTRSTGDQVTVSGIGHGTGNGLITIHPIHDLNGRDPSGRPVGAEAGTTATPASPKE